MTVKTSAKIGDNQLISNVEFSMSNFQVFIRGEFPPSVLYAFFDSAVTMLLAKIRINSRHSESPNST